MQPSAIVGLVADEEHDVRPAEQGACGQPGSRLPHFFFIEEALATDYADRLSRDALLAYLLICSGYNPRNKASLYGGAGARIRVDVSRKSFARARAELEVLGLISVVNRSSKHPKTVIAALDHPFRPGEDARDGHRYDSLVDVSDLILLPMKLIYGDTEFPEACLASLSTPEAIVMLLWCYREGDPDGYLRSDRFWWTPGADASEVVPHVSPRAAESLGIPPECATRALGELIDNELLVIEGDVDAKRRGILRIRHVVETLARCA